jgi:modulator of FtsH protease
MDRQFRTEALQLKLVDNPVAVDYVRSVFGLVLVGLVVAVLGARVGMSQALLPLVASSPWIGLFAMIGLVIWAQKAAHGPHAKLAYYVFTFGMGVLIAPLAYYYLNRAGGLQLMGTAALLTAVNVSLLALYATVSKRNFNFMGGFLLTGLISLILLQLINGFWLQSTMLGTMIAGLAVLIFNGFILYDLSRMIHSPDRLPPTAAALGLFLSIFNLFLAILRLLDRR